MWGLKPCYPYDSYSHSHMDSKPVSFANRNAARDVNPDYFSDPHSYPYSDTNKYSLSHLCSHINTRTTMGHAGT